MQKTETRRLIRELRLLCAPRVLTVLVAAPNRRPGRRCVLCRLARGSVSYAAVCRRRADATDQPEEGQEVMTSLRPPMCLRFLCAPFAYLLWLCFAVVLPVPVLFRVYAARPPYAPCFPVSFLHPPLSPVLHFLF